jgi:predicted dehydrogenase
MTQSRVRIALVGCGAVTERCHIPALRTLESAEITLLVDRDLERAQALAQRFDIPNTAASYDDVAQHADAALVALPSHLHAQASIDLLKAGVHVMVEKPMALTMADCDAMIDAAQQAERVLAVALMRRFLRNGAFVAWALQNKALGRLESFDFSEGNIFNWPSHSDYFLKRELAGGGVLADNGAHTLDQLLWWLGEDVASFEYFDDAFGGVEADCELHLTMKSGVSGRVELSRTRALRSTAIFHCEGGILEANLRNNSIRITSFDGTSGLGGFGIDKNILTPVDQPFTQLFIPLHDDWLYAIQTGSQPTVTGEIARRSVALIAACYEQRQPLNLPWLNFDKEGA